jgi:hypothetical protein
VNNLRLELFKIKNFRHRGHRVQRESQGKTIAAFIVHWTKRNVHRRDAERAESTEDTPFDLPATAGKLPSTMLRVFDRVNLAG